MRTQRRKRSSIFRASCASSNNIFSFDIAHTLIRPSVDERVAFTTRGAGGGVELDLSLHADGGQAMQQRARRMVSSSLGISSDWLTVRQMHGTDVAVVTDPDERPTVIEADAIIAAPGCPPVAVLVADCAPIAVIAGDHRLVVHAGWRGLASGIIEHAVSKLHSVCDEPPRAWIGPCIGPCHFEVGPEVPEAFDVTHPDAPSFQTVAKGRLFFDLPKAVAWCLGRSGVELKGVEWACTFCDERFFSHRRDGTTGRQGVIVW